MMNLWILWLIFGGGSQDWGESFRGEGTALKGVGCCAPWF